MFNEKELKQLQAIYDVIGRVLKGEPREHDEDCVCFMLDKLYD